MIKPKATQPTMNRRESKVGVSKKPYANDLSKQRLKKLFNMFCVHRNTARGEVAAQWKECKSCILHQVNWLSESGLLTNLCYAFWFEGVLND